MREALDELRRVVDAAIGDLAAIGAALLWAPMHATLAMVGWAERGYRGIRRVHRRLAIEAMRRR